MEPVERGGRPAALGPAPFPTPTQRALPASCRPFLPRPARPPALAPRLTPPLLLGPSPLLGGCGRAGGGGAPGAAGRLGAGQRRGCGLAGGLAAALPGDEGLRGPAEARRGRVAPADVPLDRAHLERGQRAPARQAHEAAPAAVQLQEVLQPPALLVAAASRPLALLLLLLLLLRLLRPRLLSRPGPLRGPASLFLYI